MTTQRPELTIYFDGECHLCSREIEHYKRRDTQKRVAYVDISAPDFDAQRHGIARERLHRVMHVRLASGEWVTGVDSFIAIWRVMPGWGWLAQVAQNPVAHGILGAGYTVFARVRPWLPKRKRDACATGACET